MQVEIEERDVKAVYFSLDDNDDAKEAEERLARQMTQTAEALGDLTGQANSLGRLSATMAEWII